MADETTRTEPAMTAVLSGILDDAQKLIKQHIALAQAEFREELGKTKEAAISAAAGMGVLFIGAIILAIAVAHGLAWAFPDLPLWGGYAIVGMVITAIGGGLLLLARQRATDIQLVPDETIETMKENVQWIKRRT